VATEPEPRRQRSVLEGVAQATSQLLTNHDYAAAIKEALAILGKATGVDRIFILENHPHPLPGEAATSCRFKWTNSVIDPEIENAFPRTRAWNAADIADYYARLGAGEVINSAGEARQLFLESGLDASISSSIRSLLMVPISANGQFWGSIGFDGQRTRHKWTQDEISVLRLLAACIGAAIERQQTEDKLRAEREIADTLREIGMALTSTLDLDEVLGRLLVQAKRVVSFDGANALLLENGVACVVQSVGYEAFGSSLKDIARTSFSVDQTPLMRKMIRTGMPAFCLDVQASPDWVKLPNTAWVNSWLGMPIIAQ
jgi:GAF domain-containing protein